VIPLKDLNPRRSFPAVTLLLILANVIAFVHQITLPPAAADAFVKTYALTPSHIKLALEGHRYTPMQAFLPLFTCMFLHSGFLHIIGNMWFLWIFGDNVEDQFGPLGYLLFYIVCGLGSGITQVAFSWGSKVPSLGASGAISGVLGAYLVFFPRAQILTLVPLLIIFFTVRIPAAVFIGIWFLLNFLSGISSLGVLNAGGIAWWAHVGGFLLGVLIAGFTKLIGHKPAYG
jgi:membrane associated rhomboid family serine protease